MPLVATSGMLSTPMSVSSPVSCYSEHSSSSHQYFDKPRSTRSNSSGRVVGLSALVVTTADESTRYKYVSESIQDILGYRPSELVGRSAYLIFHPDEIEMLRDIHYNSLQGERCACVAYMRLLHRDGHFVDCCVSYSTVYGETVTLYTLAEDGPSTIEHAKTARNVYDVSQHIQRRVKQPEQTFKYWSTPVSPAANADFVPNSTFRPFSHGSSPRLGGQWELPPRHLRTFFFLDRFTDTSRVIFASNNVIANTNRLPGASFYSIVRPSDRGLVQRYIDRAKAWSPVLQDEKRSGGHGYCTFSLLKIPDLPAHGHVFPVGTDESERSMPGQEFIPVEAIFCASSDGLVCIVSKIVTTPHVLTPPPSRERH